MNANATLTRREIEIAELLAWGAAKKEVADRLFISPRTVENTTRSIYEKADIQKATELCVWWFCSRCGVSWDLSPIKRTIAIVILFAFIQSNIIEELRSERYYRSGRGSEQTEARRRYEREEEYEVKYLIV